MGTMISKLGKVTLSSALAMFVCVAGLSLFASLLTSAYPVYGDELQKTADCHQPEASSTSIGNDRACGESVFRWRGRDPLDPGSYMESERRAAYLHSMALFPNVQSCTLGAEGGVTQSVALDLRWAEFETQADLEICLFRVLSGFGDIEQMKRWLISQRFEIDSERDTTDPMQKYFPKHRKILILQAGWSPKENGALWGGRWERFIYRKLTHRSSVNILLGDNDYLLEVAISHSSTWN